MFDAGIKQTRVENYSLTLTDNDPATVTYPLTFISARSTTAATTVTNLSIDRQPDKRCARVQGTVSVPLEVLYTDANGVDGSATATYTTPIDVFLYVPTPSIMPFTVQAVASVVAPEGVFNEETSGFTVSLCVTLIVKVVMSVELLIPAYGYCVTPPLQEYSQEVCAGFFELPLYPQGGKSCNTCK